MKRSFVLTLLFAAALALGACGSDGDFSTADAADTTVAETADATTTTTTTAETETTPGKDGPSMRDTPMDQV